MLPKFFSESWNFLLDLIFPIECLGCSDEGHWLCQRCLKSITPFPPEQLARLQLDGIRKIFIATDYKNSLVARSIQTLKYKGVLALANPLGEIILQNLNRRFFLRNSLLLPVPLHRARLLERGFNQAALLARVVGQRFSLPVSEGILARRRNTKAQMSLQRVARQQNIKDAFQLISPEEVTGKNIYLIDDVLTTGATLQECARALRPARPQTISAITVAHSAD